MIFLPDALRSFSKKKSASLLCRAREKNLDRAAKTAGAQFFWQGDKRARLFSLFFVPSTLAPICRVGDAARVGRRREMQKKWAQRKSESARWLLFSLGGAVLSCWSRSFFFKKNFVHDNERAPFFWCGTTTHTKKRSIVFIGQKHVDLFARWGYKKAEWMRAGL
nr:hypothetical protein [Pandoravirus massiliensis]